MKIKTFLFFCFFIGFNFIFSIIKITSFYPLFAHDYGDTLKISQWEPIVTSPIFLDKNSYSDIEEKIQKIDTEIPLNFNSQVWAFIDYFVKKDRAFTLKMMRLKNIYFPIFEKKLAKYGLPDELKYLSIIESGLSPHAVSPMGAVGLWQFIYSTGSSYGLKINSYIDERMDPEKSTEAACLFLKHLYDVFGDWELAISAYNCGAGNVRKAIRRSGKKKFWNLYRYLPRETRGYLPQFVAMIYALHYKEEYHLIDKRMDFLTPLKKIQIKQQSIDLVKVAENIRVSIEDIKRFNPKIKNLYLPKMKQYEIYIPQSRYNYFVENKEEILKKSQFTSFSKYHKKPLAKIYHKVRKGQYLGMIAKRYRTTVSKLKRWNHLNKNTIYVGQRLLIYVRGY